MMELGATVCLPRNPQCLECPVSEACTTRGEHKTTPRQPMVNRVVGHALTVLDGKVLLEQRPATETVMPGMWQLPVLREAEMPASDLHMAVRHAIMKVNYQVKVRVVPAKNVARLTMKGGERRWVRLGKLSAMPLTGLTRKVLMRAVLLATSVADDESRMA